MSTNNPYFSEQKMHVTDWFKKLPDGYRERALFNYQNFTKFDFNCNDMATAIFAFAWKETPEGHDFWLSVWRHYDATLPQLPNIKDNNDERATKHVRPVKRSRITNRAAAQAG